MKNGRLIVWHIDGHFEPKKQGLLATCERLHMMSSGSITFDEVEWNRCRELLIERVSQWTTYNGTDAFGTAVKTLIEVTLAEPHP